MVNQELIKYIKQQLQSGVDKEEIKQALLAQGWQEVDINEGFSQQEGGTSEAVGQVKTVNQEKSETADIVEDSGADNIVTVDNTESTKKPVNIKLITIVALVVVLISATGVGAWYVMVKDKVGDVIKVEENKEIDKELYKDWQTYRSEEYEFEIKYPLEWDFEELFGTTVNFYPLDTKKISEIHDYPMRVNFIKIKEGNVLYLLNSELERKQYILDNGVEIIKFLPAPTDETSMLNAIVHVNNKIYEVLVKADNREVFDKMLLTLQPIGQNVSNTILDLEDKNNEINNNVDIVEIVEEEFIDCGTSQYIDMETITDQNDFENDDALVCLGNAVLNKCESSKIIINTSDVGKVILKVLNNEECFTNRNMIDYKQTSEASKSLTCPLDIEELKLQFDTLGFDPLIAPGKFALLVFFKSEKYDTGCTIQEF